ncbi:Myb family transcription factor APL [Hordeum vulgare]|nr:Myb family transcription factor APL [Hordeum vulgare]
MDVKVYGMDSTVQKKLQMRIEAQVRYLKEILEKAQENISFDANGSAGLENARSQLTDFNLALPGLSDNGTHVYEESTEQPVKAISDDNLHDNNLDFQLYRVRSQEAKNAKCTLKIEDLLLLDLNIKGGYDLSMRGMQGMLGHKFDLLCDNVKFAEEIHERLKPVMYAYVM